MRLVDLAKKYPTMRHILKRNRKYELRREKALPLHKEST